MPKLTRKGQVTIPKEIRDSMGLHPGTEVNFMMKNGTCFLGKKARSESFNKWAGFLRGNKCSDEIIEELRGKAE